jgi:aryl-alcohol dehydrogenase-like predicted oxidoreductase
VVASGPGTFNRECLAWPGLTGAIVGARSPAQIDGWIAAATLDLEYSDMEILASEIEESGAGRVR